MRNSTMESGRHGAGSSMNVKTGTGPSKSKATPGQSPTTGSKRSFDGLHPERVKELKNEGETQAEDQVSEQAGPFNGSLDQLDAPETADHDDLNTMPYADVPAGQEEQDEPHEASIPRRRLGAVVGGNYVPKADAKSGAMHTSTKRGGTNSAFYGD